jgi:hypothetical protein
MAATPKYVVSASASAGGSGDLLDVRRPDQGPGQLLDEQPPIRLGEKRRPTESVLHRSIERRGVVHGKVPKQPCKASKGRLVAGLDEMAVDIQCRSRTSMVETCLASGQSVDGEAVGEQFDQGARMTVAVDEAAVTAVFEQQLPTAPARGAWVA